MDKPRITILNPIDQSGNVDVHVFIDKQHVFTGTFCTESFIKNQLKSESYFWSANLVMVKALSKDVIESCVLELIENDELSSIFHKEVL